MNRYQEVLKTQIDFLCFKAIKPDFKKQGRDYLLMVLFFTWLAGVGRYWDNPKAYWWQYLGLGSLMYLFIMTFILWVIIYPLKPQNWSYKNTFIFVGMTSPPAILYAVPVEKFMRMEAAQLTNVLFLTVVAIWRIILLFKYLSSSAKLKALSIFVAGTLPIVIIVASLTALNLEHVVFRIMGGMKPAEVSGNDGAYFILFIITFFSVYATPVILLMYGCLCISIRRKVVK